MFVLGYLVLVSYGFTRQVLFFLKLLSFESKLLIPTLLKLYQNKWIEPNGCSQSSSFSHWLNKVCVTDKNDSFARRAYILIQFEQKKKGDEEVKEKRALALFAWRWNRFLIKTRLWCRINYFNWLLAYRWVAKKNQFKSRLRSNLTPDVSSLILASSRCGN